MFKSKEKQTNKKTQHPTPKPPTPQVVVIQYTYEEKVPI